MLPQQEFAEIKLKLTLKSKKKPNISEEEKVSRLKKSIQTQMKNLETRERPKETFRGKQLTIKDIGMNKR